MAGIPDALDVMSVCAYCGTLKPYHAADCPHRPYAMDRNAIIEKCARVAETYPGFDINGRQIAVAIRALKDKPTK